VTTWDPSQYLLFATYRERPFDELVARIPLRAPARVVDLGCGPGTATARLAERWPAAEIVGLDNSPAMIDRASAAVIPGRLHFELGDVRTWAPSTPVDVVVSNAVLQWVPGHEDLLGGFLAALTPGGALAFSVPANFDTPIHTELRALVLSGRWTIPTEGVLRADAVLSPAGYLERLHALGAEPDVWETTYQQVLAGPDAVLEWARGTALRPVLSVLAPQERADFEAEYGAALRVAYPVDAEGRTVLPFRRIFAVARRPG
jgi:trans-aconitate 2-methyltransferase